MNAYQAKQISDRLRRIAKDLRETAIGSSRLVMYEALAKEVVETTNQIDTLRDR